MMVRRGLIVAVTGLLGAADNVLRRRADVFWGDPRSAVLGKETAPRCAEPFQKEPFQTEDGVSFHFDQERWSRAASEFITILHEAQADKLYDTHKSNKQMMADLAVIVTIA